MKTVTLLIMGMARAIGETEDPYTRKFTTRALTEQEIDEFIRDKSVYEDFYNEIKPMLERGTFIFDKSLFKWFTKQPFNNRFELWAEVTFVDTNDEGEKKFMQLIRNTGILDYSIIKKNYS